MADRTYADAPDIDNPFTRTLSGSFGGEVAAPARQQTTVDSYMVPGGGAASDRAQADIITAQRVAIKRDVARILSDARNMATVAGEKFFYRIPFKDRATGRTTFVEGPTIGCAMAAASLYGNCSVRCLPMQTSGEHWTFIAEFRDYEKGVTIQRAFQQRRNQNTGMRDGGRQEDIVFQIGQSKAMRNVVVASLSWLIAEMEEAAKGGVIDRVRAAPEKARNWLQELIEELGISLARVERIVARPVKAWTVYDMTKLFGEISSIRDGVATVDDLFPLAAAEAEIISEAKADERPKEAVKREPTRKNKVTDAVTVAPVEPAADPAIVPQAANTNSDKAATAAKEWEPGDDGDPGPGDPGPGLPQPDLEFQ